MIERIIDDLSINERHIIEQGLTTPAMMLLVKKMKEQCEKGVLIVDEDDPEFAIEFKVAKRTLAHWDNLQFVVNQLVEQQRMGHQEIENVRS